MLMYIPIWLYNVILYSRIQVAMYILYRYALCAGGEKRSGMSKRSAHI